MCQRLGVQGPEGFELWILVSSVDPSESSQILTFWEHIFCSQRSTLVTTWQKDRLKLPSGQTFLYYPNLHIGEGEKTVHG